MAYDALESQIPRAVFIGGGTRGPFTFSDVNGNPIRLRTQSHLIVRRYASVTDEVGTALVLNTDFTVNNTDVDAVTITLTVAQAVLASTERLVVQRLQDIADVISLASGGDFSGPTLAAAISILAEREQEARRDINRSIKSDWRSAEGQELPLRPATALALLGQDTNGRIVHAAAADFGSGTPVEANWLGILGVSPGAYWADALAEDLTEVTPEMFGALPNVLTTLAATTNTTAFQAMAAALSAAGSKIKRVSFKRNATYWCLPTGTANNTICCDLLQVNGVAFDGNNCLISARFSETNRQHNFWVLRNSSKNVFRGFRMEQPNAPQSTVQALDYFYLTGSALGGSNDNYISAETGAGRNGVAIARALGSTSLRCTNNEIHIRCDGTYYCISLQSDGDGTRFTIVSNNAGRSLIFYNCFGIVGDVDSRNSINDDALVVAYGYNPATEAVITTRAFKIRYRNRFSTVFGSTPVFVSHQQGDGTDRPTTIDGEFELDMSDNGQATPWESIIENRSNLQAGVVGEPAGGNKERIKISGRYDGVLASVTDAIQIGNALDGFDTLSTIVWDFEDFYAPALNRPIRLGKLVNLTGRNITAPSAALVLEAGFPITTNLSLINTTLSGFSGNWTPQDSNGPSFAGKVFGLKVSNNTGDATNDMDTAAGFAADANGHILRLASSITKRLDANWAVGTNQGGLDTGSAADGTIFEWLIKRIDTGVVDVLYSASPSSPTMPTNYTMKVLIGCFLREGGVIVQQRQFGDLAFRPTPAVDAQTNPGTSAVLRTLKVPVGVNVLARITATLFDTAPAGNTQLLVSSPELPDVAASGNAFTHNIISDNDVLQELSDSVMMDVLTNTSGQVRTRVSASGANTIVQIIVHGWTILRAGNT